MKKAILVVVMLSGALLAYNQSSRRTTSTNSNVNVNSNTNKSARDYKTSSNSVNNRERTTNTRVSTVNRNVRQTSCHQPSNTTSRSRTYKSNRHAEYTHKSHAHKSHSHKTTTYNYRVPVHADLVWSSSMHHRYVKMYPKHKWHYHYGHRISSIPVHEAKYHIGDVHNVYGRVIDVVYLHRTDEYILYVGSHSRYNQMTIVVPGAIARQFSCRPADYYMYQDINITGLISSYDNTPEILVRSNAQIKIY